MNSWLCKEINLWIYSVFSIRFHYLIGEHNKNWKGNAINDTNEEELSVSISYMKNVNKIKNQLKSIQIFFPDHNYKILLKSCELNFHPPHTTITYQYQELKVSQSSYTITTITYQYQELKARQSSYRITTITYQYQEIKVSQSSYKINLFLVEKILS